MRNTFIMLFWSLYLYASDASVAVLPNLGDPSRVRHHMSDWGSGTVNLGTYRVSPLHYADPIDTRSIVLVGDKSLLELEPEAVISCSQTEVMPTTKSILVDRILVRCER